MLAKELLDVLVCPKSKQPLIYVAPNNDEGSLVCAASRLRYRIDNGVPVMLVEEATEVSAAEVERLVAAKR